MDRSRCGRLKALSHIGDFTLTGWPRNRYHHPKTPQQLSAFYPV